MFACVAPAANPNTSRRQLKSVSVSNTVVPSSSSSQLKTPTYNSSSCVSLYETIDEIELPPREERSNSSSLFQQKPAKISNSSRSNKYSKHSIQPQSTGLDWKRNRRSSAIILGTDFHDRLDSNTSQHYPNRGYGNGNPPACSLHRSSDDLLMISSTKQFPEREFSDPLLNSHEHFDQSNRIYENIQMASGQQQHSKHNPFGDMRKRCDNRKLTKDSGYESASTLVSLNQLTASVTPVSLEQQPMISGSNNRLISPVNLANHSRSDSIDSESSFNGRKKEEPESPPPTPPIRHSSLAAEQRIKVSHSSSFVYQTDANVVDNELSLLWQQQQQTQHLYDEGQMVDRLASKQLQGMTNQSAQFVHHKQDSWPSFISSSSSSSTASLKNNRRQLKSADSHHQPCNISQSPSLSSLVINQSASGRHSIASCTSNTAQHISRSERVQQVPRQESACLASETLATKPPIFSRNRKVDEPDETSGLLPPPLPPRNHHYSGVSQIKAIQKRAVYEFYLRQKEKKERAKINGSPPDTKYHEGVGSL